MKPSLLTLSLLLFAFAFAFSNGEAVLDVDGEAVLDVDGKPVVPGVTYYIVPDADDDGGIVLGKTGNSSCPVAVLQDDSDYDYVKFSIPSGENNSAIVKRLPFDIEFTKKPDCAESSKWMVYFEREIQSHCVGIGGPKDHPGQQIINGTFRIRTINGYNLVFCLDKPPVGQPSCFYISKYYFDHGVQSRLVLLENVHTLVLLPFSIYPASYSHRGIRTVV